MPSIVVYNVAGATAVNDIAELLVIVVPGVPPAVSGVPAWIAKETNKKEVQAIKPNVNTDEER